jgi:cell division septal protein FtsQ
LRKNKNKNKNFQRGVYGGYKQFRTPKVFSGRKIKPKKEFHFPRIPYKIIIYSAIIVSAVYLIFFSSEFKIKDIIVEGNHLILTEKVDGYFPKNSNILTINLTKKKKEILKDNPGIQDLQIYRGIPNAIKIVILEYQNKIVWQTSAGQYLVSSSGIVTEKINPGDKNGIGLPVVVDDKNLPVTLGAQLLSPNFIAFVYNINSNFFNETNVKVTGFEVPDTTFGVNVKTDAGFYVKFNTIRSSAKQLSDLKNILVEKKADIHQYVDIRIDGWAYYL